jgi:phenylalanyl-tRNA synthetase beta chain
MRLPISWLRDYVDWTGTPDELAELLSMSGSEVEGIDWVGAPRDDDNMARFVIGKVLICGRHPNADKLSLCTVDVGENNGGIKQIVCGAPNVKAGQTVPVSLTGAVLWNGLKLKKASIRGIESDGMILSEAELGYEVDSEGIVELPRDWTLGAPLSSYLPVAEPVLEIEVTPNRPDCLSVYGMAREVGAVTGRGRAPPRTAGPPSFGGAPAEDDLAVEIADEDLCSRYAARVIRGVRMGESPPWLKARLTHAGMRPISNVVDVTNYVMLAWGEPLHAFDLKKIGGGKLIARRAKDGEKITTLDGVERTLDGEMCVIADVEKPLVIAGVFGSVDAEVDEDTTDLALEAATFSGPNILRTEQRTGIRSEASTRFEKGLDPELVPGGLAIASRLLAEICGGTVAPGTIDVRAGEPEPRRIAYRPAKADALLGIEVPPAEQAAILRRLECGVDEDDGAWIVPPPTFRADVEREVDLIEEVGRVYGYDKVPETLPLRRDAVGSLTPSQRLRRALRTALVEAGLDEAITYAFVPREALAPLELPEGDVRLRSVEIANPMSTEQAVMRTTLVPSLLGAVRENLVRQNPAPNLFELGRVYLWDERRVPAPEHAAGGQEGLELPHEAETLGIVLASPIVGENWTGAVRATDFYTMKGLVERALGTAGVSGASFALPVEPASGEGSPPEKGDGDERAGEDNGDKATDPLAGPFPYLHPGKSAVVTSGRVVLGYFGELRPDVAAAYEIGDATIYVAELSVDRLARKAFRRRLFEDLVTYPPASQDLAVVVDRGVAAADIVATVARAGGRLVHDVRVFDVYEGDQVPEGKRSLALRLVMRSADRTLSDKDITSIRQRVLTALEREYGAELR